MKLDRAIKILEQLKPLFHTYLHKDFENAHKLSIEALKFRQRWEDQEGDPDFPRLPGETEE